MPLITNFNNFESAIEKKFLKDGFIVQKCDNFDGLEILRNNFFEWLLNEIQIKKDLEVNLFLINFIIMSQPIKLMK